MTRFACFAVTGYNLHTRKTETVFIVSCVSDPQTLTAFHSTVQHLQTTINITSKLGEERREKGTETKSGYGLTYWSNTKPNVDVQKKNTDTKNTIAKRRLNVLQALRHTNYGYSKEHKTPVNKQFIRPIHTYAHTASQPLLKYTNLNKLQVTQNAAIRAAIGYTKTTPNDHVHQETKIFKMQDHIDM